MGLVHLPRHHDTFTLPTLGRLQGMRVIVTEDGVLPSLVAFFLDPTIAKRSPAWQNAAARAVGLLYDYTVACPPTPEAVATGDYLQGFVTALAYGTVEEDRSDPTGLYWHAADRAKVGETLRYLDQFTDWCARAYGGAPANPMRAATYGERIAAIRAREARHASNLLAHLGRRALDAGSREAAEDADARGEAFRARVVQAEREHNTVEERPPFFPREATLDLFTSGFRHPRVRHGEFWVLHNVRDMMLALLWRYGGLRRSEPLHLFVGDVMRARGDPKRDDGRQGDRCDVLLYHPQDGLSPEYRHPRQGATVRTTRTEYLKTVWGRVPRNLEVKAGRRAGWKNLMLEKGKPHWYATVHWLDDDASRLFWALYRMYLRHVRPRETGHPYLFCGQHGGPLSYDQAGEGFEAAVRRLGIASAKDDGTTIHGLRHAYGQDLTDAGMPEKHIQICMHHNVVASQQVYTAPVLSKVSDSLTAARQVLIARGDADAVTARLFSHVRRTLAA